MVYAILSIDALVYISITYLWSKIWTFVVNTDVPLVGPAGLRARANFYRGPVSWVDKGYKQFKNKLFRLWTPDGYLHIMSIEHMKELKRFEEDEITISALKIGALPKYTGVTIPPICFRLFPDGFRKGISRLVPNIVEEAQYAFSQELPPCEQWTSISIFQKMTRSVAIVNGLVLSGPELNRNPEWTDLFVNFTGDVFRTAGYLKLFPSFLRGIAILFLPSMQRVRQHYAKAHKLADPILKKRSEESQKPGYVKPIDFMQWLQDAIESEGGDYDQTRILMSIGLAGVHTTAITATQTVYELAALPDYIPILRDEINEALAMENGVLGVEALRRMKRLDSFMKETQRLNPISQIAWIRRVERPLILSDNTRITPGMLLAAPARASAMDAANFSSPNTFDPLRFYHKRQKSPSEANKHQFTTVHPEMLPWGYGKHACPGRFIASMQIKALLTLLIRDYDIRLPEPGESRPKNLEIGMGIIPDPKAVVQLRRRQQ